MRGSVARWLLIASAAAAAGQAAHAVTAPLATVGPVDVERYVGKWYEIARYPNRFQSSCRRDVTAEYRKLDDGKIEVVNRCERDNGSSDAVVGEARPGTAPGRFRVRFAPEWLSWVPWVWSPYWVIQLASDYRYAVVSEPKREYLWILSRSPRLSARDESTIFRGLEEQGFDTAALRRTEQSGANSP